MKRILFFILTCAVAAGADFYVSPDGSDSGSGSLSKPFATLARARDAARESKDAVVHIRGGFYRLDETVVFGVQDSGVSYEAYPGEKPVFSSGVEIGGWKKLADPPAALPEAARGKVWVAEVPRKRFFTLFDTEGLLPRARSAGFEPLVAPSSRKEGSGNAKNMLYFPSGALKNWSNLEDVEIFIRPQHAWIVNILPLAAVDEKAQIARTTIPGTYPLRKRHFERGSDSCWVENVLEALDEPGEWVLNSQEGKLYLWPRDDAPPQGIVVPRLKELIRVEGIIDEKGPKDTPVRNLTFRGLTFMHGERDLWTEDDKGLQHDWDMHDKANALVRLRGAENCTIEQCHFVHSGGGAIRVDLHGQENRIVGNHIEHIGGTGVLLCGYGPGTKDVNRRNLVYNNRIHHVGEIYSHSPGVFVWQSGENRVANNLIHHTPYTGMIISGVMTHFFDRPDARELVRTIRWHEVGGEPTAKTLDEIRQFLHTHDNLIEYNEIHHAMEELGDGNGIYVRGAGAGNVIRRNYIHHLLGKTFMQSAIRTDGGQMDTLIAENLIYKCTAQGITLKLNNRAKNNIIADLIQTRHNGELRPVAYLKLREGPMTGGAIKRNIFYHTGGDATFYDEVREKRFPVMAKAKDGDTDYNLFYCADNPKMSKKTLEKMQLKGIDAHSLAADPLFVDPDNGDFRLKPDSPALKLGFVPFDMSKVGLRDTKNAPRKAATDWDGQSFRDVPYKKVGERELLMDIYLPPGHTSDKAPVIYYVHGGGWSAGSKEKFGQPLMLPVFRQLAEKGFVCVGVSYRLCGKGRDVLMRDCVTDAKDGLRFLKKHAERYGVDPNRIVVWGDSAGGQLAQMLTYAGPDSFPGEGSLAAYGVQPVAGISWYGPSDFTDVDLFKTELSDKKPDRFGERIVGAADSYADNPKAFEEMSPYYWITKGSPPLLLLQGDGDATIPLAHATHLKSKADRIGADVKMVIVKNAGHNWRSAGGNPEPGVEEIQRITAEFAAQHAISK